MRSSNGLNKVQASARSLQKSESRLKAFLDLFKVRPIDSLWFSNHGFTSINLESHFWIFIVKSTKREVTYFVKVMIADRKKEV